MTTKHELCELADGVYIDPQALIDSRLLAQANSGGGKSYVVRKLCEITYGHAQQIVIDPDGEFHTLREKFDYALVGPEGECPATVETAALVARTLLELRLRAAAYVIGSADYHLSMKMIWETEQWPREYVWQPGPGVSVGPCEDCDRTRPCVNT